MPSVSGKAADHRECAMSEFNPDERQKKLIKAALQSHRKAQARGQFAPKRLVDKWSSEIGVNAPDASTDAKADTNDDTHR